MTDLWVVFIEWGQKCPCYTMFFIELYFRMFMMPERCDAFVHFIELLNNVLRCVIWYCLLYCIVYCTVLNCVLYCIALCYIVYSIALYWIVLNCIELYWIYITLMNTPTHPPHIMVSVMSPVEPCPAQTAIFWSCFSSFTTDRDSCL